MSHFEEKRSHYLTARDVLDGVSGVDEAVSSLMGALSSGTRIKVLFALLAAGEGLKDREVAELSAGEISSLIGMSDSATSHQLRVLRQLGLVERRRDGRRAFYSLSDSHLGVLLTEALYHVDHERMKQDETREGIEKWRIAADTHTMTNTDIRTDMGITGIRTGRWTRL